MVTRHQWIAAVEGAWRRHPRGDPAGENLVVAGDVERGFTRALGSPAVRFEGPGSLSHRLVASP